MDLASSALETALNATIPIIGPLTELVGFAMEQRRLRLERESRLSGDAVITDERFTIVDEVMDALREIGERSFPVTICIEDAHYADVLLSELLGRLMSAAGPILVLSTSWSGVQSSPLDAARSSALDRRIEITPDTLRIGSPFPVTASLDSLHESERLELVEDVMPHLAPETQRAVVRKYPNALALVLLSQVERLQPEVDGSLVTLTKEDVADLPVRLSDLYRDSWMTLPASVRKSLHVASLTTPRGIQPGVAAGTTWHREHLDALYLTSRSSFEALPPPEMLSGWTRSVGHGSEAFIDPNQFDIALGDLDILRTAQRADIMANLAETLKGVVSERKRIGFGHLRYSTQVAASLYAVDLVESTVYLHFVTRYVARAVKIPGERDQVLETLETWANLGYPGDNNQRYHLSVAGFSASMSSGQLEKAEEWTRKWTSWNLPLENYSYETTAIRLVRAEMFPAMARPGAVEGGETLEEVVEWATNHYGSEHPVTAAASAARVQDSSRPRGRVSPAGGSMAWSLLQRARTNESLPVTMDTLANYPSFNTITDHPEFGDFRRFVSIRRVGHNVYERSVELDPGATYEVRVLVVNSAAHILNTAERNFIGMATFARMRAVVPSRVMKGRVGRIGAEISASNTFPRSVVDSVEVRSPIDVAFRFVPASCAISSAGKVNGNVLADLGVTKNGQEFGIFSNEGALLGYSSLNGILPGGPEFACAVTYQLKVDYPDFSIDVFVSEPEERLLKRVEVPQAGRIFKISVRYSNRGTTDQRDVTLSAELPVGVELVPASVVVTNNSNPGGRVLEADRLRRFNVGHYGPGAFANLEFLVQQKPGTKLRPYAGAAAASVSATAETRNGIKTVSAPLEAPN
ncbi:hypothetical protein M3F57_12955 [Brachybacterium muris]|uniref:hypothetical protein n=1 Tax=Brachybacterium muris TaxID=219301 RepID=UPI00223BFAA4|nr:hypothetical protein [Brachybacterium muris]MCT2297025.1 hypothetical protein [Brachybacterium muris]